MTSYIVTLIISVVSFMVVGFFHHKVFPDIKDYTAIFGLFIYITNLLPTLISDVILKDDSVWNREGRITRVGLLSFLIFSLLVFLPFIESIALRIVIGVIIVINFIASNCILNQNIDKLFHEFPQRGSLTTTLAWLYPSIFIIDLLHRVGNYNYAVIPVLIMYGLLCLFSSVRKATPLET